MGGGGRMGDGGENGGWGGRMGDGGDLVFESNEVNQIHYTLS